MRPKLHELTSEKNLDQARLGMTLLDVLSLMRSRRGNFENIAEAIQFDPQTARRLLSRVNSPHFGLDNPVRDLQHAVSILGVRQVRELLINATSSSLYHQFVKLEPFLIELKKHSIAVGCYAAQLAKALRQYYPKEFYQAGLYHDLGRYVMIFSLGTEYLKLAQEAQMMNYSLHLHERDVIGYDHTEIGVIAAEYFGLSDNIIACIRDHHELTEEKREILTTRQAWIVDCVSFANLMSQNHGIVNKRSYYRPYSLSELPRPPGELNTQDIRLIGERANSEFHEIIRSLGLI